MSKVGETISVYASRLTSSTLLEDRRAACLGLRSFAKDYPASVASEALRGLIATLRKDGEDVDSIKVILETLLFLFNPNQNSAEASEELAYFIADEFTTRQDNITLLLDFLDTNDFYSRLYSLQLLSVILSSRTERTEECIFTAPLGISRLVAVLDDRREAIRNEGLSLLTYLTPSSSELQKLVAFENAFERIFGIIKLEGSLQDGDRIVEDCLILLANLLRLNVSNQSFFRETGCVPKLSKLLNDALGAENETEEVAEWAKVQRNRNIYALLAVLRLFLITGGAGTQANQASFAQHGILSQVLQLAFSRSTEVQIKAEALSTCADMIRDNPALQETFAQQLVTSVLDEPPSPSNGQSPQHNAIPKVYVIDGLLDLTLSVPTLSAFDSRAAACECIKAYFYNHPAIRKHFLRRAIDGHVSGADETANVLTTLLQPLDSHISSDPYRYWFASVLLFHLIFEDAEAKSMAMGVAEGDAENGEEVVTCIQSITANLVLGVQKAVDERVLVAYLMLICGWLFEDPDAVNDFLGEGSNIQSLIQAVLHTGGDGVMVQGLCAVLLGIVYEFSTKDSPVPRSTIHPILGSKLGRDQYIDRLTKLRAHPLLRDFEVLPQKLSSAPPGGLPDVFFDKSFVDFMKDNFSRLIRAIDRDPGYEIVVIVNGVQKGISREMVDTLRSELDEKSKALLKAEEELVTLGGQLGQEQADHRRAKETSVVELSRIKNVNEALQRHHEEYISKLRLEHDREKQIHQQQLKEAQKAAEADIDRVRAENDRAKQDYQRQLEQAQKAAESNAEIARAEHDRAIQDYQRQLEHVQKTAEANAERVRRRTDAEIADLKSKIEKLEADLDKANKNHVQDLQTAHDEYTTSKAEQDARLKRAEENAKEAEERAGTAHGKITKAETALQEKETARQAAQSELDDLLMVFGDLEEKVTRYKERLKALGESVSDDEDDDEDEDEDEDESGRRTVYQSDIKYYEICDIERTGKLKTV
ncbi:hypothetical protein EYC80_009601 [Monilinia laxa]|uniref:Vesicle tethering protein Uso1/P115-like head domain-containing protein n=1 Tax=Monilinia laxa TaxID=61186 RepID=A0A5N6JYR7_MONLA|nr:hypothetical protein EYC80_009601 [Monilinia laxa]